MYRVMIAEDESIMRKALEALVNWESVDCELVYVATNGIDALEHIESIKPDILITDIKMPGCDGIELSRQIMEKGYQVKIILLTAYADFSYAKQAIKYNVVDYVIKTGAFDALYTAIKKATSLIEEERKVPLINTNEQVKEKFIFDLLEENISDREEIIEEAKSLDISWTKYRLFQLYFILASETTKDRRLKVYKALKNFFQMLFGERLYMSLVFKKNQFMLIISDDEYTEDLLNKETTQIIDMMNNFMNLDVSMGVSTVHENIYELAEAYHECLLALNGDFVKQEKKINFYNPNTLQVKSSVNRLEIDEYIKKIISKILLARKNEVEVSLKNLFSLLRELNAKEIRSYCVILLNECMKLLGDYNISISEILEQDIDPIQYIYQSFRFEECRKLVETVVMNTMEYIIRNSYKQESLVSECLKYIENHYEENISIAELAHNLGTSASYLSRIFKESTGKTIVSTINEKKIEKAKELLKYTDLKVYEIAYKLNFDSTTYFSFFFKKYTGESPKEYGEKFKKS